MSSSRQTGGTAGPAGKEGALDRTAIEARVLRSGWLAHQAADFQAQILRSSRLIEKNEGDVVIHFGDSPTGLYGIVEGAIGLHVPSPEGKSSLASVARRGQWFGQTPLFTGRPSTLAFSVVETARLMFLPMAKAQEIVAVRPDWMRAFYAVSGFGNENAIANVGTLLVRNPARRIAASLLRIAPNPAELDADEPMTVAITQEQLGEIANAARDVVNRALKQFEALGWLSIGYRKVTIHAPESLARFVEVRD